VPVAGLVGVQFAGGKDCSLNCSFKKVNGTSDGLAFAELAAGPMTAAVLTTKTRETTIRSGPDLAMRVAPNQPMVR
jgi:hypothetical protein